MSGRTFAAVALAAAVLACNSRQTDAAAPASAPATSPGPARTVAGSGSLLGKQERHNELFKEAPIEVLSPPPVSGAPGERLNLIFEFVPHAKVKVPIYPPAYLQDFSALGGLTGPDGRVHARVLTPEEQEAGRLSYYEDGPPPAIKLAVSIPAGTEAGSYPYSANVHYFYCYDTGGICAKEEAVVEGVVDVIEGSAK